MEELLKKIDKEKEDRFKNPWNKLDKGSKFNRILLFIKMEKTNKQFDDNLENQLKTLLSSLFTSNILNKSSEIDYDIETSQIKSINNLIFDEEQQKYSFKKNEKKMKCKNQSKTNKSNLERHFNRSKKSNKTV